MERNKINCSLKEKLLSEGKVVKWFCVYINEDIERRYVKFG